MSEVDAAEIVATLRRIGGEPEMVEAKKALGGLPSSLRATLSAFANTDGGTVLLGVDEETGFSVVDLPDVVGLRDGLAQMSRDDLTPPLRLMTEIVQVEGKHIVVAEVPPSTADQRPVYVTTQGIMNGSYLRTGDGDRKMRDAEIAMVVSSRSQPTYDREAVEGTSAADLDGDAVARMLQRVRRNSPSFARLEDTTVLCRLGVLTADDAHAPLSLAGLLTFGIYPQQYFPQLMVSVVVHSAAGDRSVRFLDNATIRGSIPEMVSGALDMLRRNLAARAVMTDTGRSDRIEYPLEAIREALVNALMHRDYSPVTRGTQVQVELHPDRLEIRSPGGLYGGIIVDDLGEEGISSSRNGVLASLLSDAFLPMSTELVAENRSSGVPTMLQLARSNGLPRPQFRSAVTSFVVSMDRSQLLNPGVRAWIASLGTELATPAHEVALAMMLTGYVTNAALRQWGVDRIEASQVLRDLVARGLALKEGGRRYAQYILDPRLRPVHGTAELVPSTTTVPTAPTVADALHLAGSATSSELAATTGLARSTVLNHLNELVSTGDAEAVGSPRSPKRRYRWTGSPNLPMETA